MVWYFEKASRHSKGITWTFSSEERIKAFANANALNNTINAENRMYKLAMDELGFTQEELLNYIYLDSIMNQHKAKLLFDVNGFILNYGK